MPSRATLRVYGTLWTSTAGKTHAAGFRVEQTGKDPYHHSVILPDLQPATLIRLRACFTKRENPLPSAERRRL